MNILVVSGHLIGDNNATGKTLYNILYGINELNILQYCTDFNHVKDNALVETIFSDLKANKLYSILYKNRLKKNNDNIKSTNNAVVQRNSVKTKVKKITRSYGLLMKRRINNIDFERINDFKPDVIYTLAGDISAIDNSYFISKELKIPIVVHFMDDLIYGRFSDILEIPAKFIYRNYLKKLHRRTCYNLAISEKMASEYQRVFKKPYGYVMNCVESKGIKPKTLTENKDEYTIIFSGGLHGGRIDTILNVAAEIDKLDENIKLKLYVPKEQKEKYNGLFNFNKTFIYEFVPEEQMFENLESADILLHVESFKKKYIKYFRLSMSTKIPEYLICGRPIFCVGPSEIETVQFLKRNNIGWTICGIDSLKDELLKAISEKKSWGKYGEEALNLSKMFSKENSQKIVKEVFLRSISEYDSRRKKKL